MIASDLSAKWMWRMNHDWTINSLALKGDPMVVACDDPTGTDKFSRFNQTLQEFLDGEGYELRTAMRVHCPRTRMLAEQS